MKKHISLLLCVLMLLALCSGCAASQEPTDPTEKANPLFKGDTLKILAIGNSFSDDATEYLYDIAKAEGIQNIIIGRLFYGACSLERHVHFATTGANEYTYSKNTTGKWESTKRATLLDGLLDEDWEIITMQQNSNNSGLPESYEGHLDRLISYVNEHKTNPEAKLVWHMTWAYQSDSTHAAFPNYNSNQMTMYTMITDTVKQVILPNKNFVAMIPAGTAIQNARTSFFGDNLTRDGFHLSVLGRLIAAYTWYTVFTDTTLDTVKLEKTISGITLSEGMRSVILEAVNASRKEPLAVTNSALTA